MEKKRIAMGSLMGIGLYAFLPAVAGLLKVGFKDGPVIYPAAYHSVLYSTCYRGGDDGKPRLSAVHVMLYHRPWFYGLTHRVKSREDRDNIIARMVEHGASRSSLMQELISENARLNLNDDEE